MKADIKLYDLRRWKLSGMLLAVLAAAFGLQGCSSMLPTYQSWKGPSKDRDQIAVLHVPDDMRVASVDGKSLSSGMLSVGAMTPRISLLPGQHQVVFRYYSIWSTHTTKVSPDKLPDVVQSPLHQVRFEAKAGGSYHFAFTRPKTEDAAKVFARQSFSPLLKNADGETVAQSTSYQPPPSGQKTVPVTGVSGAAGVTPQAAQTAPARVPVTSAPVAAVPADSGLSTLDALKLLWQKASKEDKKAFLRWAFH